MTRTRNEGSAKTIGCSDTTSRREKVVAMVACDFPVGFGDCSFFNFFQCKLILHFYVAHGNYYCRVQLIRYSVCSLAFNKYDYISFTVTTFGVRICCSTHTHALKITQRQIELVLLLTLQHLTLVLPTILLCMHTCPIPTAYPYILMEGRVLLESSCCLPTITIIVFFVFLLCLIIAL